MWIEILKKEVAAKGPKTVAKELGISRSAVDLVVQGKYSASTKRILKRVEKIYGHNGGIECPVIGLLTPFQCAEFHRRAKAIGMRAGNPDTLRLYKACVRCEKRK
jgi:hypothetical protein